MIGSSLSIGVCELCLAEAMRDGRVYRSPTMMAAVSRQ